MTVVLIDQWLCDVRGYLMLNSFAGGDKGRCVQLTIGQADDGYVQMTFDDARNFFQTCINEIDAIEKKFNENPPWWEELRKSSQSETE